MSTLFTEIIERRLPAYIVAEDDAHIAFLDIAPVAHGHTLVVPKKEVDYVFDLDDVGLSKLMVFAKKVAVALQKTIACRCIGMAVLGLEVAHAHVHLVPIQGEEDLNLSGPRLAPSHDRLARLVEELQGLVRV